MPGHNVVYVLLGCLIALVGWLAWNMAGSLLWLNAAPGYARSHRCEYAALGGGGAGGYVLCDAHPIWQT